jgi:hypothetical protein
MHYSQQNQLVLPLFFPVLPRIVNKDGSKVTGIKIFTRLLSNFVPPSDFYSVISVLRTPQKTSWQDKLFGTRVIKTN